MGKKTEKEMKGNIIHNDPGKTEPQDDPCEYDQEDVVSKDLCPYCGKVFTELDANGCMVNDFGRCDDAIGEGDDGDFSFTEGFDIFDEILRLYNEIKYSEEVYDYILHLTGIEFTEALSFSEILELFPEVTVSSHEWNGGGPGCSGYYAYITVNRKSQARLIKKLTNIRDRLEMFVNAGSVRKEIETKLKSSKE